MHIAVGRGKMGREEWLKRGREKGWQGDQWRTTV